MPAQPNSRSPRWYGIPVRVVLLTFIGTLLCFAVSLLLAILGTMILSATHGIHPNMSVAYRHVALPAAVILGSVIFMLAWVMEIRQYRRAKTLSAIETATERMV